MPRFVKLTAAPVSDNGIPIPGPIVFNEDEILRVRVWQGGALDKSAIFVRSGREYIVEESVDVIAAILGADRARRPHLPAEAVFEPAETQNCVAHL